MTNRQRYVEKNSMLVKEFDRYILEHPGFADNGVCDNHRIETCTLTYRKIEARISCLIREPKRIRGAAETEVDIISIGAITISAILEFLQELLAQKDNLRC